MADFNYSLGFDIPSENTVNPTYKYKGGFPAGYQLPAPHFNWIIDKTSRAIDELQDKKFDRGGVYTGDMNDLVLAGQYRVQASNANLPTKAYYGQVFVGRGVLTGVNNDTVVQIAVSYNQSKMYHRGAVFKDGVWTWEEWSEVYSNRNKPTPADIGAAEAVKHKLITYSSLADIGLTAGSETIANIVAKMADNSMLVYQTDSANADIYPHTNLVVTVKRVNANRVEFLATRVNGSQIWFGNYHKDSGWTGWKQIYHESALPTPAQIGAVATETILNATADLNNVVTSGMYRLGSTPANAPANSDYGQLLVVHGGQDTIAQLLFPYRSTAMYVRTGFPSSIGGNGQWGEWIKMANDSHTHALTDSDITGTLPITKGGTGATTAAQALKNLGITATAAELNYVDGVTSNVQTQLNGKSPTTHGHGLTDSGITGILPIAKGGTGASDVVNARKNLNSGITGSYQGTGNGSGGLMYNFDTGARGSNLLMIVGKSYVGWLTPHGGYMIEHVNGSIYGKVTTYGDSSTKADHRAYYANGYIQLHTNNAAINGDGNDYNFVCM